MRIAVTGREGQLVQCLLERAKADPTLTLIALGRPELDLADPDSIAAALGAEKVDLIVNAAAHTEVDKAESERSRAFAINGAGAGHVAAVAWQLALPVIQVSTDYVFNGEGDEAYDEASPTDPVSVYGASKLAGEQAVRAGNPHHLIVRTAWVYSPFGKNFVKTMLRLAAERDELSVVDDQWGNPTCALDLADGILAAARVLATPGFDAWGVYHLAGFGATSWAGFATQVMAVSEKLAGPSARVAPVPGSQYKTAAKRPSNSQLDSAKFERVFGYRAPPWQGSVAHVVERLLQS